MHSHQCIMTKMKFRCGFVFFYLYIGITLALTTTSSPTLKSCSNDNKLVPSKMMGSSNFESIVIGKSNPNDGQDEVSNSGSSDILAPSTGETALLQYGRLFSSSSDAESSAPIGGIRSMSRNERILRIVLSWTLLIFAKSVALGSPLYFRSLIERAAIIDKSLIMAESFNTKRSLFLDFEKGFESLVQASALGLMIGYGATRLASGFIQLTSELILSPVTTTVAEILPKQAFSAALRSASKRSDDSVRLPSSKKNAKDINGANNLDESSTSGFARRALDRGLRASNQLLYRSIFNLLPSFIESFCVLVLIWKKTNWILGITAGAVASTFVLVTSYIMQYRLRFMRAQLADEGTANGFAEDALSMAETVASFGTIHTEESRYSKALRGVSRSAITVRRSFSVLKLIQAFILGLGSSAIVFSAWATSHSYLVHMGSEAAQSRRSIAGTLVLAQVQYPVGCVLCL